MVREQWPDLPIFHAICKEMKSMKTTLKVLALVAVCSLLPLALQAEQAAPQATPAPLFLAAPSGCSAPATELTLPFLDPTLGATPRATCNATATCGVHSPVSCSGNNSCTSQDRNCDAGINGGVSCDGVGTACPHTQSCLDGCAAAWESCVAACPPGILNPCRIACSEERGNCHCNC
jgi:hypothetical protein